MREPDGRERTAGSITSQPLLVTSRSSMESAVLGGLPAGTGKHHTPAIPFPELLVDHWVSEKLKFTVATSWVHWLLLA